MEKKFRIVVPAELTKAEDGEWRVRGIATTASRDAQGEVILQHGIDLTPIDQGKGVLNWEHQKGPESTVGLLDGYQKLDQGLMIEGRLFKNHTKAKAIQQIMSSLGKSDVGRVGLSVQGSILERSGNDGKVIKKCQINAVALTMNPVNQDTYADLVKSMTSNNMELEWQAKEKGIEKVEEVPIFTPSQVINLLEKTLFIGGGYATTTPSERSSGDALAQEDLDKKKKKVTFGEEEKNPAKKLRRLSKDMYKAQMGGILEKIQKLYPDCSRNQIWEVVKDRLSKKFPDMENTEI